MSAIPSIMIMTPMFLVFNFIGKDGVQIGVFDSVVICREGVFFKTRRGKFALLAKSTDHLHLISFDTCECLTCENRGTRGRSMFERSCLMGR
jgi:hypothetical protein